MYCPDRPYNKAVDVTPSDTVNFEAGLCDALWIGPDDNGDSGDVVVVMENGSVITFADVPPGSVLPVAAKRVNNTNTTAEQIVALYRV